MDAYDQGYNPVDVKLAKVKGKKLSPDKIYDTVSESTVIVSPVGLCDEFYPNGEKCSRIHSYPATGYIIDSKGIIVANYHVVNSYGTKVNKDARDVLTVMLKDGNVFSVKEVLLAEKSNDLAIIRIEPNGTALPALSVALEDPKIRVPAYIVSHPKGYFYSFSSGIVTDKFSEINAGSYRNLMAISADFAAGSSGGPIVDDKANVIGTVTYTKTLQHSGDATKTQMVLKAIILSSSLLGLIRKGNRN